MSRGGWWSRLPVHSPSLLNDHRHDPVMSAAASITRGSRVPRRNANGRKLRCRRSAVRAAAAVAAERSYVRVALCARCGCLKKCTHAHTHVHSVGWPLYGKLRHIPQEMGAALVRDHCLSVVHRSGGYRRVPVGLTPGSSRSRPSVMTGDGEARRRAAGPCG